MLDRFFLLEAHRGQILPQGDYDLRLVALSLLVAAVASYFALQLADKARSSPTPGLRRGALLVGAVTLGAGVWSMHFIGMLAYQVCTTVRYEPWLTALSVLPAMAAAWVALRVLASARQSRVGLLGGGVLMGVGIGLMHFGGMAAIRSNALLRYDPAWFLASLLIAVGLAVTALWVRHALERRPGLGARSADLLAALVMGGAISGMHYAAMRAAHFVGLEEQVSGSALEQNLGLAMGVAFMAVVVSALAALVSAALRHRQLFMALQRNESQLQALFDVAVDGVLRMDAAGTILDANAAALQIFGARREDLVGQTLEHWVPAAAELRPRGRAVAECSGRRRDGSLIPLRLALGHAEAGGGEAAMGVAFVTDISERRRVERALQDSEQEHRSLIANLPGVAAHGVHDFASGRTELRFVSEGIEALSGWRADELVGAAQGLDLLVHPDDLAVGGSLARRGPPRLGNYQLEYRILRRDGQVRWVAETGTLSALPDSPLCRVDALVLDVTEARLRNAEFAGVLAAIRRALVVVEFDLDGCIVHANERFLQLFGYSAEELLGRHHRLLCLPMELHSPAYREHWAALRRGEVRSGEYERVGRDGRPVWIQATYNPILDAAGKPLRIVKFITDLTDRHRLEQDLRQAKVRAELAADAKSAFLANMSHEIRTPMNAIIGFTEVVLDGELPADARRHMQTVQRSARALLGLLNDILDTAKMEQGAMTLEQRPFSLAQLCQDVVQTLGLNARRKGLALTLDLDPALPTQVLGDPLRVRQVLMNLAGNAVKFTEQGEVKLSAHPLDDGRVELAVRDTGIGIAPDRLEHIFDPFAQADATMSRRFGGTGLGTTIARQLCELMGGEIGVESTLGQGSRFWVRLPLAATDEEPQAAHTARERVTLPPLRILVADDVPENLSLLELRLRSMGHEVVTAVHGVQALQRLDEGRFDLALLDVQMPEMDGLQVCRALRERERQSGAHLPVIALTASAMQGDRDLTEQAGMDGFATKPIDWPDLTAEIARVLGLQPQPAEPAATAAQPEAALLPPGHDWSEGLRRWGDARLLREQLQRFLADALARWPAGQEDAAWAHRLRGTLANLGYGVLSAPLLALEQGAASDPATAWVGLRAQLQALWAALPAAANPEPSPSAPQPRQPEPADLQALDQALAQGELPEPLIQRILAALGPQRGQALETALADFEFEQARRLLAALKEPHP
ncbi:MHYT domain-containing protein [Inhella sp.]|uniref:MHYT domain-containing protein n=1 Tax=Inhella sp. TaxID=1921806 RepID=UPI0035B42451